MVPRHKPIVKAGVTGLFAAEVLGANICYSFAYALEFIFATEDRNSRWLRFGRPFVFVAGVLFSVILAFVGGRNISMIEYHSIRCGRRPPFYVCTSRCKD